MKKLAGVCLFFLFGLYAISQTNIHSHNDYAGPAPLADALESRAFSIEVDVFLTRHGLSVAHTLKEVERKKTLSALYLDPIIALFKKNKGYISGDTAYKTALVIDIKQNGKEVLGELVRILEPLRIYFDRSLNPHAVQVIISGDRGPFSDWKNYPRYIFFDGRPFEEYDKYAIEKLAMISDNYFKYLSARNNRGDSAKIKAVVQRAHQLNKPFRFWASPDNETTWKFLQDCGVDIINTDKPKDCRNFLDRSGREDN
jgi:glycerophosphoryl diester phosphodiesterase